MKRVSIKDVAKEAGVSIASVSYVLNNRKEGRISEETMKMVRKAAADLNYRPNKIAKSLKTQRTFTLGLIVADIANPYFSELARIIEDEARKIDCTLIIGSCDENKEKFESLIDTFCERQVDGLIIAPVEDCADFLKKIEKNNVPFVLIDRNMPGVEAASIQIDNYDACYKGVKHLVDGGSKNICFINYKEDLQNLVNREKGFLQAIKDQNITDYKILAIDKDFIKNDINKGIEEIIEHNQIDALFFSSNRLAVTGLKKLRELNVKVPEQLAILAFDKTEAYDLFRVPISYIKQPLKTIGVSAIEILDRQIKEKSKITESIVLKSRLIEKESSIK